MSGVVKILLLGSRGSATTLGLESLAGKAVAAGSMRIADYVTPVDEHPRIQFDRASLWLDGGNELQLYSPVDSNESPSVDWESLMGHFHGVCLLIDNRLPRPLDELQSFILSLGSVALSRRLVVGITHCDVATSVSLSTYRDWLVRESLRVPVLQLDPRSAREVACVMASLLMTLSQ